MPILSPEDRAILWRKTITADADSRDAMRRVLAKEILDSLASRLDMYAGYDELVVDTIELLDLSGYLGRDAVREAFEQVEEQEDSPEALAATLAHQLRESADVEHLGVDARIRAIDLAARWREELLSRQSATPKFLTVADVAARYKVTPQAVYKWIAKGRIEADQTPGGSWRVPAAQFQSDRPAFDEHASRELQKRLLRLHDNQPIPSDEEVTDELSRRDES